MKTLIRKELRLSRKFLLIWMGMDALLCLSAYLEYLALKDTMADLVVLINGFPELLRIMFGCNGDLSTVIGWFGCIYFWIAILNYAYAVYLGITCVSKEIKQHTAEYLFTKPAARKEIVYAKTLSSLLNLLILAVFSSIINYLTGALPLGGLENRLAFLTTMLGMFFTEAVLFSMALLLSGAVTSYPKSVWLGAVMLLTFYGIYIAADIFRISSLYILTPLKYFDVLAVAEHGLSIIFLLISCVLTAGCIFTAANLWSARELV